MTLLSVSPMKNDSTWALLDAGSLRGSYYRLTGSQLDIARAIGFEPGWRYAAQPAA